MGWRADAGGGGGCEECGGPGPAQRDYGPAEPGHLLPVAAVPQRDRDRRVRNWNLRAVLAGKEAGERRRHCLTGGVERGVAVVRRWRGGVGSVGQASGMERWTVGDLGDRGLDPEALEIDLPRGARGGCTAKRNVGWGGC